MSKSVFYLLGIMIALITGETTIGQNQPPEYVGTAAQFRDYLMAEMYYPLQAREKKLSADIRVNFTVLANGEVTDAHAEGENSDLFADEAIRLVRRAIWKPGLLKGEPTTRSASAEVSFQYKKYNRRLKKRGYDFPSIDTIPADTSVLVFENRQTDSPATPWMKPGTNLNEFLAKNLHYPESARKQNIAGKVKVRFVVEPAGYAAHFLIEQHVNGGCTEEAVRLLSEMRWKPAVKNGKAVRSWYFMSFGFGSSGNEFQYFPANQGGNSMN